jgi:hypothetical protein
MKLTVSRLLQIFYLLKPSLFVKCLLVNFDKKICTMFGRTMCFSSNSSCIVPGYLSSALWKIRDLHLIYPTPTPSSRSLINYLNILRKMQNVGRTWTRASQSGRRLDLTWEVMTSSLVFDVIYVLQHLKRHFFLMDFGATCKF